MEQGRTAQIMDNLIAAGKAVPMIVVSANSNVRSRNGGMGGGYNWQGMQTFRSELLENVLPFVEKTYRVKKDRKSRAMCGLSMGGGQSFYIGLRDPEVFANVGVFSTGMFGGISGASNFDLESEVPGMLTDTKTFNKQFDVFFVSCGEQDPRIEYTRNIVKKMREGGVEVRFNSYPGDHEWQVWRKSLHEFAQYLFKEVSYLSQNISSAICAIKMSGMPYLNFLCRVLWCQTFIPSQAPTLPPITANPRSVASGIRHLERFAFILSMPYTMNVTTLMAIK